MREQLENAEEQEKKRVQDVYDEAGFQIQKLREQLEMKENNNSALRKSNNAWALIHSSSDLPRSDCAANNSFNSVISTDLLEQERKMEITIDETVSNITSTKDYDNDNGDDNNDYDDNDDESKRKDQILGVSISPSNITDVLTNSSVAGPGLPDDSQTRPIGRDHEES